MVPVPAGSSEAAPAAMPPTSPKEVADTMLCTRVAVEGTCQLEMSNTAVIGKHR